MGILDSDIDWDKIEVGGGGESTPFPAGQYTLEAIEYEDKTFPSSGNQGVAMTFKVLGPTNANRLIWENFVLTGESKVGLQRLKSFCASAGLDVSSQQLNKAMVNSAMNQPIQANISIDAGSNGYPPKNKVKSFLTGNAQAPAAPQAQAQVPQPAQPTGQQVNWQD